MTPEQVTSELVPIQRELSIIAERLRIKQAANQVYIAIEEPKRKSLGSWLKCIASFLLWGGAALAVYIGIGFVVAECVAWLMGAIR